MQDMVIQGEESDQDKIDFSKEHITDPFSKPAGEKDVDEEEESQSSPPNLHTIHESQES